MELEFLENQMKKPSSFVVLYGRRRVGKSELIKQFIKNETVTLCVGMILCFCVLCVLV
jgi:AAA+ ATPase superfamily predicted ATPase